MVPLFSISIIVVMVWLRYFSISWIKCSKWVLAWCYGVIKTKRQKLKIYGISGLGADKRVFDFLKLDFPLIPVEWIEPSEKETLKDYSLRLSKVIDTKSDFVLVGVSFGGLVAVEISKVFKPRLTILISSAETKNELRPVYRSIGKIGILNSLPNKLFDLPRNIANFIFGTNNKELLNSILDDTDLRFAKWAINELVNWNNIDRIENVVRIHGTKDKLIPWNSLDKVELIDNGEHFMIVDRADEISKVINEKIKTHHINRYSTYPVTIKHNKTGKYITTTRSEMFF